MDKIEFWKQKYTTANDWLILFQQRNYNLNKENENLKNKIKQFQNKSENNQQKKELQRLKKELEEERDAVAKIL